MLAGKSHAFCYFRLAESRLAALSAGGHGPRCLCTAAKGAAFAAADWWTKAVGWLLREQKSRLLLPGGKGRRPLSAENDSRRPLSTDNEQPQATFSQ
jgi:hypothetical protein